LRRYRRCSCMLLLCRLLVLEHCASPQKSRDGIMVDIISRFWSKEPSTSFEALLYVCARRSRVQGFETPCFTIWIQDILFNNVISPSIVVQHDKPHSRTALFMWQSHAMITCDFSGVRSGNSCSCIIDLECCQYVNCCRTTYKHVAHNTVRLIWRNITIRQNPR